MHPFSVLTLGIFIAGYITARWDLIAQLYAVTIFAWEHGVVVSIKQSASAERPMRADAFVLQARAAKGFAVLSVFFVLFLLPIERAASRETKLVGRVPHPTTRHAEEQMTASTICPAGHISTRTTASTRVLLNV